MDQLCNSCIEIMQRLSHLTGISYVTINVVLFIIINPLSTFLAVISAIVIAKAKHHKVVL